MIKVMTSNRFFTMGSLLDLINECFSLFATDDTKDLETS